MKVLIIDDEEMNRELLVEYLSDEGFDLIEACDGEEGLKTLRENPDVSVILLDKMMPNMDGMQLLEIIKSDEQLKKIPVIMQTAAADPQSFVDGVSSGAYYYLTKPYKQDILLTVVHAAINDSRYISNITEEVTKHKETLGLLKNAFFEFKTIEEAQNLAYFVANSFPDPGGAILGLSEMMINAVEHGNLGISYEEKGKLMLEGNLAEEINKRTWMMENLGKVVKVYFEKNEEQVQVTVKDEGDGFDWEQFFEMTPDRASAPNGRGILMSKATSFDEMEYIGNGNEVRCIVILEKQKNSKIA